MWRKNVPKTTKELKLVEELTINIPNTEEGQWLQEQLLAHARYHCAEGINGCNNPEDVQKISNLLVSVLGSSINK
jgi:hypothetical protein